MAKKAKNAISPTRSEDYPQWYQQVINAADLAENSPVRGCMVIKPWGYALWENIQKNLDKMFKASGCKNAYFPLFIPLSFLEKEAEHVDGFAKECAVVTHHRLKAGADGKLIPDGELTEPLIVRPTSETIIGAMFAKWCQSYRDLPLLINQWANVVRWEMRTRLFLRTAEFLWQEGHTVHATEAEAVEKTMEMLKVYADFAENYMAMPVIQGEKTAGERFPGAVSTYCIEAMMQDRKALQAGTSHFLGQNFSKASEIKYLDDNNQEIYAWTTSWGVSTRLIGGMIMTHGDDDGLALPPRLAPSQIVIMPVIHEESARAGVLEYCHKLIAQLADQKYAGSEIRVELDDRDLRGGEKTWQWVKKGVPVRVEIGPRDIAEDSVFVARRDQGPKDKKSIKRDAFVAGIADMLQDVQDSMLAKAKNFREENSRHIDSRDEFYEFFTPENADKPEIHGGFAWSYFNCDEQIEQQLQDELKVTVRCIPLEGADEGTCIFSGKPGKKVVFAKSY